MDNQELKEFIGLAIADLKINLNRLTDSVDGVRSSIREIEISTTKSIAEIRKEVEEIRRDVQDNKDDIKSLGDSQKFKWKSLTEQRESDKKEQAEKEQRQAEVNQAIRILTKLMWAVIGILLGIGIPFVWQMIVNGGVRGISVP